MKHETLVQKDRDYVWHPFTQMGMYNQQDPIIIEKGKEAICMIREVASI